MSAVIDVTSTTLDRPSSSVLDDRSLFGHPKGLGLLFVVEMWERFSYYGMRALLVLYLVGHLKWTDGDAARLYGTYTGLVYLTPLIGGYLADRFIGTRRSLVIGSIIIALGHFALAIETMPFFYAGLALICIGTGFFKPNVSTMVGQMYREGDTRRDSGFTIFYMGINTGAAIAPLVCGSLGQSERFGWSWGFGAAGVGMVLGLIVYLWGRNRYLPGIGYAGKSDPNNAAAQAIEQLQTPADKSAMSFVPGVIGAIIGGGLAFLGGATWVPMAMSTAAGAVVASTLVGTHGEERKRVIALFIVVFFVVFFWMAFEQAGSSMNLFADRYTNLTTTSGFKIPSSWFQSVNPACIIIFAPILAALWTKLQRAGKEPSTALKMVAGLVLLGLGFVVLVLGSKGVDACVAQYGKGAAQCAVASPMWLVIAYLLHTLGELCLSPVGLSYVTKVAPLRFASMLMGTWFLANSAANYLGGFLASKTENIASQAQFFSIPVATSIGSAVLLLLLVPLLRNLTKSVNA